MFEIGKCFKISLFIEMGVQLQWMRPKKLTQENLDTLIRPQKLIKM